jgi:ubiquinone/menaquinone biosynthesis C-methylase UbiE
LPSWLLPEGVNASLWEYASTSWLAESEDAYFLDHPLFRRDREEVTSRFVEPGRIADLGCGTGRMALEFARRGFHATAVELSAAMLRKVGEKARAEGLSVALLRANLCRLGCLPDGSFDYATSLFSTIGMIRSAPARSVAVAEAARVLRPGGRLALHAHNIWLNARVKGARTWLARHLLRTALRHPEAGDRTMTYRGIPHMQVHLYRWPELKRDVLRAGLAIEEVICLDAHAQTIASPRLFPSVRADGWLIFARKR